MPEDAKEAIIQAGGGSGDLLNGGEVETTGPRLSFRVISALDTRDPHLYLYTFQELGGKRPEGRRQWRIRTR